MTTLVSPKNDTLILPELAEIVLQTSRAHLAVRLTGASGELFANEFFPDSSGKVIVRDVSSIAEASLGDEPCGEFSLSADDMPVYRFRAVRCAVNPGEPGQQHLASRFLTSMLSERDTDISRKETLSAWNASSEACTVRCDYIAPDGTLSRQTVAISRTSSSGQLETFDVSPSRFNTVQGKLLVGYTVLMGDREQKYRVLLDPPPYDPAVVFRNIYGVWETMYFCGERIDDAQYSRETASVLGRFRTYRIDETLQFTASTGPMRHGAERIARDLARSKAVFLLNSDGTAGQEVTLTDCTVKHSNSDDFSPVYTFTFRNAERFPLEKAPAAPYRIFDYTFDKTYE